MYAITSGRPEYTDLVIIVDLVWKKFLKNVNTGLYLNSSVRCHAAEQPLSCAAAATAAAAVAVGLLAAA